MILPLISLLIDQLARAKRLNISATIYNPRNPPDSVRLVFVTPETSLTKDFQSYLLRLRTFYQLDRIIIDECHIIINKNSNFRRQLSRLGELIDFKTQLILLTATLPPRYQSDLFNKLYIKESEVKIYRSSSNRVNIRYSVHLEQSNDQILEFIQQKSDQYPNDRLIIYTRTRDIANNLQKRLKWLVYYSNSPQRDQTLRKFLDLSNGRIIATSSLGLGLDIPNARAIIHIGRPYSLLDYAQESGRAGRDRVFSEAILLDPISNQSISQSKRHFTRDERFESDRISEYLGSECRRMTLNKYLDDSVSKCQNNDEKCDNCKSRPRYIYYIKVFILILIGSIIDNQSEINIDNESPENSSTSSENEQEIEEIPQGIFLLSIKYRSNIYINNIYIEFDYIRESDTQLSLISDRKRLQNREKATKFEKIASLIRFFQDRCPYCYINDISDDNHLLYYCRQSGSQRYKALYVEYRDNFRQFKTIRNLLACTRCLLPPSLCKHWKYDEKDAKWMITNQDCTYPDIVLSVFVIGVYFEKESSLSSHYYTQNLRIYSISHNRGRDEIAYLSEGYSWGEIESIRILDIFFESSKEILATRSIDIYNSELL